MQFNQSEHSRKEDASLHNGAPESEAASASSSSARGSEHWGWHGGLLKVHDQKLIRDPHHCQGDPLPCQCRDPEVILIAEGRSRG